MKDERGSPKGGREKREKGNTGGGETSVRVSEDGGKGEG
jgi:hypothetical protein